MRKAISILSLILFLGCSGQSNCKKTEEPVSVPVPTDPVPIPTTTEVPTALPSVIVVPEPESVIKWKTLEEVSALAVSNPDLCVFAYFEDIVTGNKELEKAFLNSNVITIVNKLFVAVKFPLTKENTLLVMSDFDISKLPALIIAPASDGLVLQVEGVVTGEALYEAIVANNQPGKIFADCEKARNKID